MACQTFIGAENVNCLGTTQVPHIIRQVLQVREEIRANQIRAEVKHHIVKHGRVEVISMNS